MALTSSLSAILNRPENVLEEGGTNHVICLFQKIPAEPWRLKSTSQGPDPGPSPGSSRNPPTLIAYIRGKLRLQNQFSSKRKQSAHFLSSTRRTHHGELHRQAKSACWRLPLLLGCHLAYFRLILALGTYPHHHLRQPPSRELSLLTPQLEALHGHLRSMLSVLMVKRLKETSPSLHLETLEWAPPSLVILQR